MDTMADAEIELINVILLSRFMQDRLPYLIGHFDSTTSFQQTLCQLIIVVFDRIKE